MENAVSSVIVEATKQRKEKIRAGTAAWRKAYKNYLYYQKSSDYMQRAWYDTWWAPPQPHGKAPEVPASGNSSAVNQTQPMLNVTAMPIVQLNASIPGAHPCQISTEQSGNTNQRCLSRDAHNETSGATWLKAGS